MTDKPLMNLSEVAAALGISRRTLYNYPDVMKRLAARQPIGSRRYARVEVERLLNNESLATFGRRRSA